VLQRFDVIAQVSNALPDRGLIVVFEILKNGAPHGHFRRAVGGKARAETKDVPDICGREFAAVAFRKSGEIGHARAQRWSSGAAAFAVGAVA